MFAQNAMALHVIVVGHYRQQTNSTIHKLMSIAWLKKAPNQERLSASVLHHLFSQTLAMVATVSLQNNDPINQHQVSLNVSCHAWSPEATDMTHQGDLTSHCL